MAGLYPPLSVPGQVVREGQKFDQGRYHSLLLADLLLGLRTGISLFALQNITRRRSMPDLSPVLHLIKEFYPN